MSSEASII